MIYIEAIVKCAPDAVTRRAGGGNPEAWRLMIDVDLDGEGLVEIAEVPPLQPQGGDRVRGLPRLVLQLCGSKVATVRAIMTIR